MRHLAPCATLALLIIAVPGLARAQEWQVRGSAASVEAGSTVEGMRAGLRFSCIGGAPELALTHNGAVFDRDRAHTVVVSVDGLAHVLQAGARPSGRPGDDDFVARAGPAELGALMDALARGRSVEVSGPAGRYTLALTGSSRALATFRQECPQAR